MTVLDPGLGEIPVEVNNLKRNSVFIKNYDDDLKKQSKYLCQWKDLKCGVLIKNVRKLHIFKKRVNLMFRFFSLPVFTWIFGHVLSSFRLLLFHCSVVYSAFFLTLVQSLGRLNGESSVFSPGKPLDQAFRSLLLLSSLVQNLTLFSVKLTIHLFSHLITKIKKEKCKFWCPFLELKPDPTAITRAKKKSDQSMMTSFLHYLSNCL